MTLIKRFRVLTGDCAVPVAVHYFMDGAAHVLRCEDRVERLDRPPRQVDIAIIADIREAPAPARFL